MMMMRYQRVSPDCVPLSNGKKPNMRASPKEEMNMMTENTTTTTTSSTVSSLESKPFRFRSQDPSPLSQFGGLPTSPSPESRSTHHSPGRTPSPSRAGSGGDVLLQWGHKKRSRVSRTEIRVLADESSSSAQARQAKVQRRAAHAAAMADKSMPPPPPPPPVPSSSSTSSFSNGKLRKEASGLLPNRNLEDRSAVVSGSPSRSTLVGNGRAASRSIAGKRSPPPEKSERKMPSCSGRSAKDDKANGSSDHRANHVDSTSLQSEQIAGGANHSGGAGAEKVNYEVAEWPRIYLALSRKEKEDDFLAMKGTKLPQRPKKRAKNVDRTLQYCFPGMWLSDLTRNRYEVREKKCVKKKRRGLKGMESVESESE
ncbi:uncharacterized protein LOC126787699 isoform X2 [Argentina anserina]|uniref:uncharacterized protein LOC126787699 isoform X2 n=1 Tax=Argentina anserina TaxID=57926 RepID=UPI0021766E6E|nr:uncharacterized protein LOC126787699 isoform X2 [Potentilla anserina]